MASIRFGGKSSPVCPLLSIQVAPRKQSVLLGAPPHPPYSASEPSPFPVQRSLAPEPSPRCSPHPSWPEECRREDGKKVHKSPALGGNRSELISAISGTVGSPGTGSQKDGCGKPHLSLPLLLPPALPFSLSHFKKCPSTPPYPPKYPPS